MMAENREDEDKGWEKVKVKDEDEILSLQTLELCFEMLVAKR